MILETLSSSLPQVMAFLLNYIPTVGGAISIIAPLTITFLDPDKSLSDILVVFSVPGFAHILCGNIIEPNLFGSAFELHPIVVMFCLVMWSSLWGVVGAILSVPLTCCLKLAIKPHIYRHPYALIFYHLLEFRVPTEEEWRLTVGSGGLFGSGGGGAGTPGGGGVGFGTYSGVV